MKWITLSKIRIFSNIFFFENFFTSREKCFATFSCYLDISRSNSTKNILFCDIDYYWQFLYRKRAKNIIRTVNIKLSRMAKKVFFTWNWDINSCLGFAFHFYTYLRVLWELEILDVLLQLVHSKNEILISKNEIKNNWLDIFICRGLPVLSKVMDKILKLSFSFVQRTVNW